MTTVTKFQGHGTACNGLTTSTSVNKETCHTSAACLVMTASFKFDVCVSCCMFVPVLPCEPGYLSKDSGVSICSYSYNTHTEKCINFFFFKGCGVWTYLKKILHI